MTDLDPILPEVARFIAETGMTKTAFGVSASKDPALVFELEKGRELRRSTRQRIRNFMAAHIAASTPEPAR